MSTSPNDAMRATRPYPGHEVTKTPLKQTQSPKQASPNPATAPSDNTDSTMPDTRGAAPQPKRLWKTGVFKSDTHTEEEHDTVKALMRLRYPEQSQGPVPSPLTPPHRSNADHAAESPFPPTSSVNGHLPPPSDSPVKSVAQESQNYTQPGYETEADEDTEAAQAAEALMMMANSQPGGSADKQEGEVPFQTKHFYGPPKEEGNHKKAESQVVDEAEKKGSSELTVVQRRRLISSGATKRGKDYLY